APVSISHTTPPDLYPLSLHDALPISSACRYLVSFRTRSTAGPLDPPATKESATRLRQSSSLMGSCPTPTSVNEWPRPLANSWPRSEEHTSELQSRENLVCRLLLEKKK